MSIDTDLLDRLMEGHSPSGLFGKDGVISELTKALAERALSTELDAHLTEERADPSPEGQNAEKPTDQSNLEPEVAGLRPENRQIREESEN